MRDLLLDLTASYEETVLAGRGYSDGVGDGELDPAVEQLVRAVNTIKVF